METGEYSLMIDNVFYRDQSTNQTKYKPILPLNKTSGHLGAGTYKNILDFSLVSNLGVRTLLTFPNNIQKL